jgi:hypothetical protein
MRLHFASIAVAGALACGAGVFACTADIHDNTVSIPNAAVSMSSSVDTSDVKPNEQLPIHCDVQNVTLVAPDAQAPSPTPDSGTSSGADSGAVADSGPPQNPSENDDNTGFLEIHLDSEDTPALLITAQVSFSVTIPADTKDGDHKLICRVHKHDGTATTAVAELKITVRTS